MRELLRSPLDYYAPTQTPRAPRHPRVTRVVTFVLMVAIAAGLTVAARTVWAHEDPGRSVRESLIVQIKQSEETVDRLGREVSELEATSAILTREEAPLTSTDPTARRANGADELTGKGVTVTLTEADSTNRDNRVADTDLRLVVNQLWAAGAEGVAVNGQRLGPTTAIRRAGGTILVDFTGIEAPYQVIAIGDPEELSKALTSAEVGEYFSALYSIYGITVRTRTTTELQLPPARVRPLNSVTIATTTEE